MFSLAKQNDKIIHKKNLDHSDMFMLSQSWALYAHQPLWLPLKSTIS